MRRLPHRGPALPRLAFALLLACIAPAHARGLALPSADEATIVAERPTTLILQRFGPNPAIVVFDFPSLDQQGAMLDRLAALVEKHGLPHDRLLDDAALAQAIRAGGDTPANWYYGHDYRAADVARFFHLADRDHIQLNPQEQRLRGLVAGFDAGAGGFGALISLTAADPAVHIAASDRAAILHHEIAHGAYFTQPAYALHVARFWHQALTAAERQSVRSYLAGQEYDPTLEDLMINEMQAYLIFTRNKRYFDPAGFGLAPARVIALRQQFAIGLAAGPASPRGLQGDIAAVLPAASPATTPPASRIAPGLQ